MSGDRTVRIALIQIECHPAFYIGHKAYLEEPFFADPPYLSALAANGVDMSELRELCLRTYIAWHRGRLEQILQWLASLHPPPNLVVLPEGAVPWQCLATVHDFAVRSDCIVVAGTHSFQKTLAARRAYGQLGVSDTRLRNLWKRRRSWPVSFAVVVSPTKSIILQKRALSPFEMTDSVSPDLEMPTLQPHRFKSTRYEDTLLVGICAEVLRIHNVTEPYSGVAIASYQEKPSHFGSFIQTQIRNGKFTAYCNDGRFGGSGIHYVRDVRNPEWFDEGLLQGVLPPGDAVLVRDISLSARAVQVGVSSPAKPSTLVALASIVYEDAINAEAEVAKRLAEARELGDSAAKARSLRELPQKGANSLQHARILHLADLAERGTDTEGLWDAIGRDCIVAAPGLRNIEAGLAELCHSELVEGLSGEHGLSPSTSKTYLDLMRTCAGKRRAATPATRGALAASAESRAIIDRDEEVAEVIRFLDSDRLWICLLHGFREIGKTAVLRKTLSQSSLEAGTIVTAELGRESSAEFLLRQLVGSRADGLEVLDKNSEKIKEVLAYELRKQKLVVVEQAHNAASHGEFRNAALQVFFTALADVCASVRIKLIVESRWRIPLAVSDTTVVKPLGVRELTRRRISDGVALLDAQLRRVGLSPLHVDFSERQRVVSKLGGHPILLALAADQAYVDGWESVLSSMESRRGAPSLYVQSAIKDLSLSRESATVLRLLSGCRTPVPRGVVSAVVDFDAETVIRELIMLCLVDVDQDRRIRIPDLIRLCFRFEGLQESLRRCLHERCSEWYEEEARRSESIPAAIEAEYHARLSGRSVPYASGLVDASLGVARRLHDSQDYQGARQVIDGVLRATRSRDALRLAAQIYARCGLFDEALTKAKDVFAQDPRDTWLLSEIARAALNQHRDEIAEDLLGLARRAHVEDAAISLVEGRMLLRRRDFPRALQAFEKAKRLSRRNAWPWYYLGRTLLRMGRFGDAIEALHDGEEFYYEKECTNPLVLRLLRVNLGTAYLLKGDLGSADSWLSMLYEESPDDPEVARAYALLLIHREGVQSAAEAFERLSKAKLEDRHHRYQLHLYYGLFLLNTGDPAGASKEFEAAHREDRDNVYVLAQWARTLYTLACEASGEDEWAADDVKLAETYAKQCGTIVAKILDFDPDNSVARGLQEDLVRFGVDVKPPGRT